jgi:hypothetical protein
MSTTHTPNTSDRPTCIDCGKQTYSMYRTTVRGGARTKSVANYDASEKSRRGLRCGTCADSQVEALQAADNAIRKEAAAR